MRKTVTKKMGVAVAAAVVALVSSCSAGGSPSADGPVTLRFLSYSYATACCTKGIEDLIAAFEAAHPDIDVEPEAVAVQDVLTKLRADVAAGASPDVVQLGWSKAAEARANLPLVPVQDIPSEQEWTDATAGIAPGVMRAVAVDGRTDIMPFSLSVPGVYYNADLFRRAGLDPDRPPTTIDEVRAAAAAIVGTGAQGVFFGVADTSRSDFLTQSVVNSNGGALVDPTGRVTVDSPEVVGALTILADLTRDGLQPAVRVEDAQAAFAAGNLGMFITSTAGMTAMEDATAGVFDLRTTGFPAFGAPAAPTHSGAGLAVLGEDERTRRAAWEFIRFLTSEEGFTTLTEEIGYLPLRPDIVDDPAFLGDYFAQNTHLLPALEQLATVRPYTAFAGERANQAVVLLQDQAVEPIVLRGADPQATLTEVAARIRELTGAP